MDDLKSMTFEFILTPPIIQPHPQELVEDWIGDMPTKVLHPVMVVNGVSPEGIVTPGEYPNTKNAWPPCTLNQQQDWNLSQATSHIP